MEYKWVVLTVTTVSTKMDGSREASEGPRGKRESLWATIPGGMPFMDSLRIGIEQLSLYATQMRPIIVHAMKEEAAALALSFLPGRFSTGMEEALRGGQMREPELTPEMILATYGTTSISKTRDSSESN